MDLEKMSTEEVKALGFDVTMTLNNADRNLQLIKAVLAKREAENENRKDNLESNLQRFPIVA